MIKSKFFHNKRVILTLGLILIALGLISNEKVLTALLSPDGVLAPRSVVIIWVFDVATIVMGGVLAISRSFARLFDLFVGLVLTTLALFGAEKVFYRLNHPPPAADAPPAPYVRHEGEYAYDFFRPDELLGYRPRPDAQVTSIKKSDDTIIYDVVYSIDDYQRRLTPLENGAQRTQFLLFFGGSFVFGEGVNDAETLPFYVGQGASDYRPYNYGLSGYGPQQMLAKLQSNELAGEVPEKEGGAIYVFIDGHVERAIGSMFVYNAWGDRMPYYTTDWGGNLIRKGNFNTGRPLLSTLFRTLDKSEIARYYTLNIPGALRDSHYRFAVRLMAEARDMFREKFKSDQFYVLIYPDEGDYFEDMAAHLAAAELKVLNYDELLKLDEAAGLAIAGDGHPTAKAHQIVAQHIVADLGIGAGEPE